MMSGLPRTVPDERAAANCSVVAHVGRGWLPARTLRVGCGSRVGRGSRAEPCAGASGFAGGPAFGDHQSGGGGGARLSRGFSRVWSVQGLTAAPRHPSLIVVRSGCGRRDRVEALMPSRFRHRRRPTWAVGSTVVGWNGAKGVRGRSAPTGRAAAGRAAAGRAAAGRTGSYVGFLDSGARRVGSIAFRAALGDHRARRWREQESWFGAASFYRARARTAPRLPQSADVSDTLPRERWQGGVEGAKAGLRPQPRAAPRPCRRAVAGRGELSFRCSNLERSAWAW